MRCSRIIPFPLGLMLAVALNIGTRGVSAQHEEVEKPDSGAQVASDLLIGSIWIPTGNLKYRDHLKADKQVQEFTALPFKELIMQVMDEGRAYYSSDLMPRVLGLSSQTDPLEHFIRELRAADSRLKIVAWISPLNAGTANPLIPYPSGHIAKEHPEWLNRRQDNRTEDVDGMQFLEPSLTEVQTYTAGIIEELVSRYDFDGLYIDPIHDPGENGRWGYHPSAIQSWKKTRNRRSMPDYDDASWIAFRNESYTQYLSMVAEAARQANPDIFISVGARADGLPPAGLNSFTRSTVYLEYHQEWPAWMKLGLIDRIYLKNFRSEEFEKDLFNQWATLALQGGKRDSVEVSIGIGGYRNPAVEALAQLRRVASMQPTGIALWSYERPVLDIGSRNLFIDTIRRTVLSPEYLRRLAQAQGSPRITRLHSGITRTVKPIFKDSGLKDVAVAEIEDEMLPEPPPIYVEPAVGELIYVDPLPEKKGIKQTSSKQPDAAEIPGSIPLLDYNIPSRDEMIEELLNDPRFRGSTPWAMIRPDEHVRQYLHENFVNIF
jgi:uncharacterized lipoprotein YddW (UPF0748 family)